jgi:hypothetical protein
MLPGGRAKAVPRSPEIACRGADRHSHVRQRTEAHGARAYISEWPVISRYSARGETREANLVTSSPLEPSMNGRTVVTAVMAMCLTTGGVAFAQDNGDRNDRGCSDPAPSAGQQDRDAQGRQPAGTSNVKRPEEPGAGPEHAFQGASDSRPDTATSNTWSMTGAATTRAPRPAATIGFRRAPTMFWSRLPPASSRSSC